MAPQQLQMRIEKMQSPDSDLRFMALNDLANDLAKNQLGNQDEQSEAKLTRQVVSLLADKNSEVKNQAVNLGQLIKVVRPAQMDSTIDQLIDLGQLIKVVRPAQMDSTIDQLIEYSGGKDDELRDIAGLALKTVTAELPLDGTVAPRAIQKLVPKLLQQLGSASTPPDALIETLATLTILVTRFPSQVPPQEPMTVLTPLLLHARPAVRKRAISTIASFVPTLSQDELQQFISSTILPGLQPAASLEKQRTTVHLVAAVARYLASSLNEVVPSVLKGVKEEDEELREAGLQPSPALDALAPRFLKQLLKTLSPKSAPPVQALSLLNTLLTPDSFNSKLLGGTEVQLFKILVHPEALPTFSLLVKHALPPDDVKQKLVVLMHERHPRVAADAIKAGTELVQKSQDAAFSTSLQSEARERLKNSSTDAAVRAVCARAIGALFVAKVPYEEEDWELVRRSGAVGVVTGVLKEIKEKEVDITLNKAWLDANIVWAVDLVRKGSGSAKVEAIGCLEALLAESQGEIPDSVQTPLIENLTTYISQSDPQLLIKSFELLTFLLRNWPQKWFASIEKQILPRIYPLATETLLPGSLDALRGFLYALASADEQIASHLVGGLKIAYDKAGTGAGNVSKCLGAVVRAQTPIAAGTINEFAKHIKPTTKASQNSLVLCLLTVGEIGRFIDMSNQSDVFDNSLGFFKSDAEEVRNAAAFAVGNIAIGSQERFLPIIVKLVQTDDEKRLLSMHALKEVVSHCSQAHLESIAESLWQPLFDTGSSHEKALNIAASCLGKLTTTNPARFLPPLEARLQDPSPTVRALVVSAMRHMFGFEGGQGLDDLLKPFVVVFLGLLDDKDLNVKRLALAALNQAARNKPRLIEDQLPALLPKLYDETTPKPELIRIMEMGPWRHKIDDGLEARRTAYETMYTLLDTSISKLGLDEFLTIVLRGLSDESNEVKVLCHMMLHRLSQVAPSATSQRLDETVEPLRAAMKEVTMDKNTVKQDLEQAAELQRSALRAAAALNTLSHPGAPKFVAFVESLEKGKLASEFREQKA
ncbi:unnamed protein product [Rhizoctonia solani]|uniref:TATA-binding protein interacting (TIP20) domain-containing protein n=1 Tax=Rhizoctonia solani TaxID=456999 RepID=A0A8H3BUS7_9AGAM|nr:unnamed protein product [Rhizoctonia solani]